MKTMIVLEIDHTKDIANLAEMIAGRAYNIDGVENAEVVKESIGLPVLSAERLQAMGFTLEEISLGSHDVERS
jgi:hypothetical protein